MTGMDVKGQAPRLSSWKARLSLVLVAVGVVGMSLLVRYYWGPGSASAQAPQPRRPKVQASSATRRPAASPASRAASNGSQAAPAPSKTQQTMAVVNGQAITRQELANECLRRYGHDVLESIVNKQLIWQACNQRGIKITQEDVTSEVNRVAAKFGLSTDRWLTLLRDERDISPEQYQREIIWPTLALRRLAAEHIEVTDAELRQAFETEYGPRVKVRMIAVSSRSKAEQVLAQCRENPDKFGDIAKDHSEDENSASARGLIPPIRRHLGDEHFERVAFGLKEGEISDIIPFANQFVILKCEKRIPETFIASQHLDNARQRLHDIIRDQKLRSTASDLFKQLQQAAQVVNVWNDPQLQRQHPGVAARINGGQITIRQLAEECVIRNGNEVLEGEINRRILTQELARRRLQVTQQDIDREVARAADAYGYLRPDGTPDIDRWLKTITEQDAVSVELYVHDAVWPTVALKKLVGNKVEVTQDDLRKGFDANYGERVEVLAIVLGNHRQAQKVWEMARSNPTDQFFGELANQYSIEPVSRANLGKVPPIRRHGGQRLVEEEAFALKPGELSGIIAAGERFIILRCLGRTKPVVQEFEAVRDELHRDIQEKKLRLEMAKEFDRLKEAAQIDNFLAGTSQSGKRVQATTMAPRRTSRSATPASPRSRAAVR